MSESINKAVEIVTAQRGLHAETVQKKWPAEGIVYVRLFNDEGGEEWVLLERGREYDATYTALQRAANRLKGCYGGVCHL